MSPAPRKPAVIAAIVIAALVLIGVVILLQSPAKASAAEPVIHEEVGILLLRLSDFDIGSGEFIADLYLQITCDRPCDPKPEFVNGNVIEMNKYEGATKRYHAWRVRAELQQEVDLRRFPFEEGRLAIEIEDQLQDVTKMTYVVDEKSTVDPDVSLPNHRLKPGWDARVVEHDYPFFQQTYSRFIFSVGYETPALSVAVKDLLPAALITLYGFLAFLMTPAAEQPRFVVASSALIALVFYGVNFTSSVPNTEYLTFADKYVVASILLVLLTLGAQVVLANEIRSQARPEHMARVNRVTAIAVVSLWIVLQAFAAAPLFG